MEKVFWLEYYQDEDSWGDVRGESIYGKSESGVEVHFSAHNLNECPEDAIIGRDLFGAADFIDALNLGIKLGKEGYSAIGIADLKEDD